MEYGSAIENDSLKIGDYITIKNMKMNSFLCAEGILLEDVVVHDSVTTFEDALFCIHLQRQYSASKELEVYLQQYYHGDKTNDDPNSVKYVQALQRGRDSENRLNESYMKQKMGTPILFGEIIQLLHLKSGKFLTIVPDQLARDERENIRISLSSEGNSFSWLQLLPRYKIDREGDRILSNTEVLFKVADRPNEYLHCSEKDPPNEYFREVNCSLETSSWKLTLYQNVKHSFDTSQLLCSQLVVIHDPESHSNVTICQPVVNDVDGGGAEADHSARPSPIRRSTSTSSVGRLSSSNKSFSSSTPGPSLFGNSLSTNGPSKVALKSVESDPINQTEIIDTNCVWVMETGESEGHGGPIAWKTDLVRFRNLNTGKYLAIETSSPSMNTPVATEITHLTVKDNSSVPGTLFGIHEVYSSGLNYLTHGKPIQLHHEGLWLQRGEYDDSVSAYLCVGAKDKSRAFNFLINRYIENTSQARDTVLKSNPIQATTEIDLNRGTIEDPMDVYVGVAARNFLKKYHDMTVVPIADFSAGTLWPNFDRRSELAHFETMIKKVIRFTQGFPLVAENLVVTDTPMKPSPRLIAHRQNMLCDQGTLALMMSFIQRLTPISVRTDNTVGAVGNSKGPVYRSEEEKIIVTMGQTILHSILSLLHHTTVNNHRNQMVVGDAMPILLAHVGAQQLAAKCVTDMLSSNMELQEKKIGAREISIFTDKLRASKMNSMYLNLLRACCSCQERGVVHNQTTVTNVVFKDFNDIIIQVHADHSKTMKVEWIQGLFIPNKFEATSPVFGQKLFTKGLPQLSLSWTTNSIDFSPLGLFGKLSVPIADLYGLDCEQKPTPNKLAVAEYFIAELFLAAEMCLGRNYHAIQKMEELFSYETLVTLLKMNLNESLKSAVVKLLLRLYVDRDPQVISSVPCLTRTWSEVVKNEKPQLPKVDVSRENQFCLLQQIISEKMESMRGSHWDGLSLHMMELLNKLIVFNFYGTSDKLRDVIEPLVYALDRRNVAPIQDQTNELTKKIKPRPTTKMKRSNSSGKDARVLPDTPVATETSLSEGDFDKAAEPTQEKECWQKTVLSALESLYAVLAVVALVLVAISVSIYETISNTKNPAYSIFDLLVTAIFATEVTTRFYCHMYVRRSVRTFVNSPLNWVDMGTVAIDLVLLGAPNLAGSGAEYTKALRAIRLVRLVRLFRAARLVQKLKDLAGIRYEEWKMPVRYARSPRTELVTMVECVNILAYVERIIEDRNLSLLLQGFHNWEASDNPTKASAIDIFQSVVQETKSLSFGCEDFDEIFIDNIMCPNNDLVQGLLDVLMTHHSSTRLLLENAKNVQLLVSKKRERQYRSIDHNLLDLERHAGTNDIWGELKTESDHRINKVVRDILKDLRDYCRVRCRVLVFDQEYEPDKVIQDLLRNLGFYDISFTILRLLEDINEDTKPIQAQNNKEIVAMCNELMYWFLLDNPANQGLAFNELDFFLGTMDLQIGSHKVIEAIFSNNEDLMRACPRAYIEEFTEKICRLGHNPHYLTLLASITHSGEKNVLENQYETVKQLIAPARLSKLSSFCCSIHDPLYHEKQEMMAPFLKAEHDVALDELPSELCYHLEFLRVLAGCTVGRNNITTVEAKVQSVFHFGDIIDAMLDHQSILLVKIRLGYFLYNSMLDVEINIPGMAQSARMWQLLVEAVTVFENGFKFLNEIEKTGWENTAVRRQELEYLIVNAMIVSGFFTCTYDPTKLRTDDALVTNDTMHLSTIEVNQLMFALFTSLKEIFDLNSSVLSLEHKKYIINSLESLNRQTGKLFLSSVEDLREESRENVKQTEEDPQKQNTTNDENGLVASNLESLNLEDRILLKYTEFLTILQESQVVENISIDENKQFIHKIEKLPFMSDTSAISDVRYEPFIQKLVLHIRERLVILGDQKYLDPHCVQTSIWIIRSFRTMIENRWGMSIYERDEDGGEREDLAAAPVVKALNNCGATTLCLDLISVGIDSNLMIECVKLCVAMLFKEGGNLLVQQTIFDYLNIPTNNTEFFFKQMRTSLHKLIAWHKWNDAIQLAEGENPNLPEDVVIVRFLQLMCEGHFKPAQDILRDQSHSNPNSINLLDDFVNYLNCVSRMPCRTSTNAASRISATILEVIQGPCEKNQKYFVLNTELTETINRIMRSKPVRDCVLVEELELKKTCIDILQGLLEGQGGKKTVYERVLSVIHLDVIQMLCALPTEEKGKSSSTQEMQEDEDAEEAVAILRTESLVLLQMFCDYKPQLRFELDLMKDASSLVGSEVACVEIMWRGELQRRFFHIPKICSDLAKASKDNLVEEVDRSNLETKLQDFVFRSYELYREVTHQQVLKRWRISGIFSRSNQNRVTWISFTFTCIINLFMLGFYDASDGTPTLPHAVRVIVDILNYMQLASASFTLILYLIVRAPVKYQHYAASGYSTLLSILYTSTDGMTVYYFIYVIVCALAINVSDILLTFLLLDIVVKNSTTRDVLYSVINPRKQLAMTVLLGVFVIYIFSFFIFYNFRGDMLDGLTKKDCSTLFKCFKFAVGYGLRYPNGVSDQMKHTLGTRYPVDVLFFLIVLIVLLNVVFGIIIDTFGNLRNKKIQRLLDTTEKCFICGIDKQIFDRSSVLPNGFKIHITTDHNMWNYLFFIIYVWEQDKDDDDGLEQYVRKSLETNDISWFPMNKALQLSVANSAEDDLRIALSSDVDHVDIKLKTKIQSFQNYLTESLDRISLNLKKESEKSMEGIGQAQGTGQGTGLPNSAGAGLSGSNSRRQSTRHSQSVGSAGSKGTSRVTSANNEIKFIPLREEIILEGS